MSSWADGADHFVTGPVYASVDGNGLLNVTLEPTPLYEEGSLYTWTMIPPASVEPPHISGFLCVPDISGTVDLAPLLVPASRTEGNTAYYVAQCRALALSALNTAAAHTHTASQISDATLYGRNLLTAPSLADQRTILGIDSPFATEDQVIQGLDEALPVNSAGVYAAIADSERRMSDDLQTRLPAAMTDGVTSPGISPERYCVTSEGAPGYLPPVAFPLVVGSSEKGRVLEWNGSGSLATDDEGAARLAPIGAMALASGRIWRVRAVYRRATESADPSGDAVRVSIQWMGADFTAADLSVAETDIIVQTALAPADGWQTVTAVIAQADATGVDHFNTQAIYARVFIEQQGNSSYEEGAQISVVELVQEDITFAEVVTDVAAGIDARVTVLENRDVYATTTLANGTDLHTLTTPGDFTVMSAVNAPSMSGTTIGGTFRERNSTTAHALVWDLSASKGGLYWANKVSGTWGNWQEAASVEYVDGEIQSLANDIAAMATSYTARNSAYTVVAGDRGKVIEATSGTWTLSLTSTVTLGSGFSVIIANTGSGTITIDPASAELIDGAATFTLGPDRMVMLMCTGSAWLTLALAGSVTSTNIDTTSGRLLKVGDFGLGSTAAIDVTDYNAITATGIYRNASVATGSPIASSLYWSVLHIAYASDGTASQLAMRSAGTVIDEMYFRRKAAGSWSSWNRLFHSGNLIGTVSQSGGVPTGTVIERGSNANGEYVRFADGTQICTKAISGLGPISTAAGALFVATGTTIGTLPATFAAVPARTLDVSQSAGVAAWVQGATAPSVSAGGVVQLVKATSAANTDFAITATFIGRWF